MILKVTTSAFLPECRRNIRNGHPQRQNGQRLGMLREHRTGIWKAQAETRIYGKRGDFYSITCIWAWLPCPESSFLQYAQSLAIIVQIDWFMKYIRTLPNQTLSIFQYFFSFFTDQFSTTLRYFDDLPSLKLRVRPLKITVREDSEIPNLVSPSIKKVQKMLLSGRVVITTIQLRNSIKQVWPSQPTWRMGSQDSDTWIITVGNQTSTKHLFSLQLIEEFRGGFTSSISTSVQTGWKIPVFNRKSLENHHEFIGNTSWNGGFFMAHVSFRGGIFL